MRDAVSCPNCFHPVHVDPGSPPGSAKCLKCGQDIRLANEDDAPTYALGIRECPKCRADCAVEAVVCLGCGFNFQTGRQHRTRREPFHASWQSFLSFGARWLLFGIAEVLLLAAFLFGWRVGILVFGLGTIGLAVILGTFQHITLSRSPEGKVALRIQRWVCFYPSFNQTLNLKQYKHVVLGYSGPSEDDSRGIRGMLRDSDDYSESYALSIVRIDGESRTICRGMDEAEAREIADTICKVAGLHYG
jgi:hypothetical protein